MAEEGTRRDTVLLIGREASLASAVERELASHDADVRVFRELNDALRFAWEEHPPLVIIDLTLPGIDGVKIARALKGEPASPKILAVGPESTLVDLKRALRKEHRPDRTVLSSQPIGRVVADALELLRPPQPRGVAPPTTVDHGFAGLLVDLWRRSATGILEVHAGDIHAERVRTTLYFLNGEPVFAEHGSLADSLGRTLVRDGSLSEAQLARAITRMTEELVASEQMRLGEVLIELGMMSPPQVNQALETQVRQKLISCFQWRAIDSGFDERDDFLHEVGVFKCQVQPLLLEGIRKYYDTARVAAILGPRLEQYPRLRSDLGTVMNRFRLGATEQKFLRGMTGNRTIARLQESSNLDRLAAGQLIAALVLADELELWNEPTTSDLVPVEGSQDLTPMPVSAAIAGDEGAYIVAEYLRMKGKSDAQVLGVDPNASSEEIEMAFLIGEQRFGAEAARELAPALARKASEIYALMRASRDRMLEADRRARRASMTRPAPSAVAPTPMRDPRLAAEQAYQRGKQNLAESSLVRALDEFQHALELVPEAVEFKLLAEYTRYLLASTDVARREAKDRARVLAEKTIAGDPRHAKAHAILGRFLRLEGNHPEAEKHLRLALSLDRHDRLPEKELALIAKEDGKKKKR